MIRIQDAESMELMSESVIRELPRKCECGHELVLTDNLVQLYCPNRGCFLKIGARLEEMAKLIGADGWGASTCIDVCRQLGLSSPIDIFDDGVSSSYPEGVSAWDKKMRNIMVALDKEWELYEVVQLLRLKGIGTIANKLFRGYNTIEEAYNDFENGKAILIAERLGIGKGDESVLAINVYNTLIESKEELLKAEKIFKIKKSSKEQIKIAITGGVDGFRSKNKFIEKLNELSKEGVTYFLNGTVTQDTELLICDEGESNSNKYRKAKSYGIRIMTSHELVEELIFGGKDE